MKILVTGATGFVGGHLAESLVRAGYEVKALARSASDTSMLEGFGIEIVRGDIADSAAVEQAIKGCRVVYHLAAKASHARMSSKQYHVVNVQGTDNVARASIKAGVERLVYCSSGGVYGTIKSPPVDEDTNPHPNSFYRASKLLGEHAVRAYQEKKGLPVVIARIASVMGPRSISNWLGLFRAIATRRLRIIGMGQNHCHPGYISDIVDGMRRCGERRGVEGQCYVIAGKEPVTITQLVGMIAQALDIPAPRARLPIAPFRAFHQLAQAVYRRFDVELPHSGRYELFLSDTMFSTSKAQRELGYCPTLSASEAIDRTAQWYREHGFLA